MLRTHKVRRGLVPGVIGLVWLISGTCSYVYEIIQWHIRNSQQFLQRVRDLPFGISGLLSFWWVDK